MISAKALYDYLDEKVDFHPSIIIDLFGYNNWSKDMKKNREDLVTMFLGLYEGLYIMDVSYKEIYRCFTQNKLDELIHTKYSINKSKYYREFYEKKIKIGNTFIVQKSENKEPENEPFIYSTIQPPYHYNNYQKQLPKVVDSMGSIDEIILHKINKYKFQDKEKNRQITDEYVSLNDVKKLLFKQENKCYVCGDNVIIEEWRPNCLYQFTLDRIDNKLPHNKNNVLICCYYCNCYSCKNDETDICLYKLCPNSCHTIKRNITRKRCYVPKEEIQRLLIK